jgi:two-component system phosphate regulon sensor histidine kinase PhoR
MTHEFKTPISTISLACEAMVDQDMGAKTEPSPYIQIIRDENQRLMVLVERILQNATLERGDLKLNKEQVNLNEVIHDVIQTAQLRVRKKNGEIEIDLPQSFVYIEADRFHLTNLISNLLDNAIKYSKEDPRIAVRLKQEGKLVSLSIEDAGVGIKKEHLNKIFDKLYRIPTGNVHNVKGFGLGLSYVKAIATLHGWNITVRSKYGSGTTFTLEIQN